MKKLFALLLALCLLLSLTACGASSKASVAYEEAAEAPASMNMAADTAAGALRGESGSGNTDTLPDNRKWIITVDMTVETDDLESLQEALAESISELAGYVEDQSIYNGSNYASRRYRHANMTVRIPAENVDQFTGEVEGIANVVSNNLRREDVTLQYVDTEGRVTALQTEEARLLELLAEAETMSDLLEIEARLSDVRYELESYTSQLRTLDNQINYATIYLYIEEVQEYTPVEEPTLWERITDGFSESLEGLGESLQDLLVLVIVSLPFLAVYGTLAVIVIIGIRKVTKKQRAKRQQKEQGQK